MSAEVTQQGAIPSPRREAVRVVLLTICFLTLAGRGMFATFRELPGEFAILQAGGFEAAAVLSFAADLCLPATIVGIVFLLIYSLACAVTGKRVSPRTGWIAAGGVFGFQVLRVVLLFAAGGVTREAILQPGSLMLLGGAAVIVGGYWLADRYWIRKR